MGEEGWSCFARLPAGIADPSVTLTLNWLRPRPTHEEFELRADEVEGRERRRISRRRTLSVVLLILLIGGVVASMTVDDAQELAFLDRGRDGAIANWIAATVGAIAFAVFAQTSVAEARYQRAAPRRVAYEEARRRFAAVDTWRQTRCETVFWSSKLDEAGFEREAADLLAGHFKTGQVMMTRAENDYGIDVLVCAGKQKIVAQCKQWKSERVGAADVRALAGAKAYFGADRALLLTLGGPTDAIDQCADIAAAQSLELWDVAKIVAVARGLLNQ
jgi:HJR/Mrr/RecB family endonuclease